MFNLWLLRLTRPKLIKDKQKYKSNAIKGKVHREKKKKTNVSFRQVGMRRRWKKGKKKKN